MTTFSLLFRMAFLLSGGGGSRRAAQALAAAVALGERFHWAYLKEADMK